MIIVQEKALEIWVSIFTEAYKIHHLFTVRSTCLKEVPIKKNDAQECLLTLLEIL